MSLLFPGSVEGASNPTYGNFHGNKAPQPTALRAAAELNRYPVCWGEQRETQTQKPRLDG